MQGATGRNVGVERGRELLTVMMVEVKGWRKDEGREKVQEK